MRFVVASALFLVLLAPNAAACTAPTGPEETVTLVIDSTTETLHALDTGLTFRANHCYGPFRLPLSFDGRFAAWRDHGAAHVSIADAVSGTIQNISAAATWSAGEGLLLDVQGTLRVRELGSGNVSTVSAPDGMGWFALYGALALAATQTGAGPDGSVGFSIYDASGDGWIVEDHSPVDNGWAAGITDWLGFDREWIVFESQSAFYSFHIPRAVVDGPLGEPAADSTPAPFPDRRGELLDIRGDVAYLVEPRGSLGSPYTERAWSVNLTSSAMEGHGRPAGDWVDGVRAWFRLDLVPTPSPSHPGPAPDQGSDSTQGDAPPGAPAVTPSVAVVLIALGVAIAAAFTRRRTT